MQLDFTKQRAIYIYGAGEVGKKCANALSKSGFNIECIIDKNKKGDDICPPYHAVLLEDVGGMYIDYSNAIVVICLADGVLHRIVAETLYDKGFKYIVFLPIDLGLDDHEQNQIIIQYNQILKGDITENIVVYDYKELLTEQFLKQDSFLKYSESELIVNIPLEMLYSEDFVNTKNDKSKFHGSDDVYDVPMVAYDWYIDLWRFFDGKTDDLSRFFGSFSYELDDIQKTKELKSRWKLYQMYERQLKNGISFFGASAPEAAYNVYRKCFNLVGGHHRTTYLIYKGFTMIPCRVSRDDFDRWYNEPVAGKLADYMLANEIKKTRFPIPHPMFQNFPADRETYGTRSWGEVLRFFQEEGLSSLEGYKVVDATDSEGYYLRNLSQLLPEVTDRVTLDIAFEELLDSFLKFSPDQVFTDIHGVTKHGKYDFVFADDKAIANEMHSFGITKQAVLELLNEITGRYLFLESADPDIETLLLSERYGFVICRHLLKEYDGTKISIMAVYGKYYFVNSSG